MYYYLRDNINDLNDPMPLFDEEQRSFAFISQLTSLNKYLSIISPTRFGEILIVQN